MLLGLRACPDCRPLQVGEDGEVPRGWGLARASANGTQLDPPARQEGGRARRGLGSRQRQRTHSPAPGLAVLPAPPSYFPPGEPVSQPSKAGPCLPGAARQGGSRGRRVGGEAGPLKAKHGAGRGLPRATPFPFPG